MPKVPKIGGVSLPKLPKALPTPKVGGRLRRNAVTKMPDMRGVNAAGVGKFQKFMTVLTVADIATSVTQMGLGIAQHNEMMEMQQNA